jgi:hypothetical protein
MLIIFGTYRVAPKLVAYRNDWCNHCDKPALAQQWRSFYVGHLYWIPFLPLGFYKTWRCKLCGKGPRARLRTATGCIVAGLLVFGLMFLLTLTGPYDGEAAPAAWVSRFALAALAAVFALWLKSRLKELPPQRIVEPLMNDRCLVCGGTMIDSPRWHCEECDFSRYGD